MIRDSLEIFCRAVSSGQIDIYNEFSLQHELGIYLRSLFPKFKIQFERNVDFFGFRKQLFLKKEIDISVINNSNELTFAIELKYPRNGQYPEQMFKFCEDIKFLEQLKAAGTEKAFLIILFDDNLFYNGNSGGIYDYFRKGSVLTGDIRKPTGKKDKVVNIKGRYTISWKPNNGILKYSIIEIS